MNTKETLKKIANQLTMCFYNGENDKLLGGDPRTARRTHCRRYPGKT